MNLRSLQILRAVAGASVVGYHVVLQPGVPGAVGAFGVDIFFVLSGFVMAMVVHEGPGARDFAVARVVRIVPLYWLMTTGLLLLALVAPWTLKSTQADLSSFLKSLFFIPFFKSNGAPHPMLPVGWSLNYEMLFYLLLWLGLLAGRRHALWTAAVGLFVVVAVARMAPPGVAHAFYGDAIVLEFLLGFAAHALHRRWLPAGNARCLLPIAAALWLGMAALEARGVDYAWRCVAFGLPAMLMLLAVVQSEPGLQGEQRAVKWLVGIGDASYATYLVHLYVIELVRLGAGRVGVDFRALPVALLAFAAALAAGQILYGIVDRPLHRALKARWLGRSNGARLEAEPARVSP